MIYIRTSTYKGVFKTREHYSSFKCQLKDCMEHYDDRNDAIERVGQEDPNDFKLFGPNENKDLICKHFITIFKGLCYLVLRERGIDDNNRYIYLRRDENNNAITIDILII